MAVEDESDDEEDPLQGAETGDCGDKNKTSITGDGTLVSTSGQSAVDITVVAVEGGTGTVAITDPDLGVEGSAESSIGSQACEPEDSHEEIESHDGPDVVGTTGARRLFGDEGVTNNNPCKDTADKGKCILVQHFAVHQVSCDAENDDAQQDLETADHDDPGRGLLNVLLLWHASYRCDWRNRCNRRLGVAILAFRLYVGHCIVVSVDIPYIPLVVLASLKD